MSYEGYTEKRKASNKNYLDTKERITLWLSKEEKQELEARAAAAGKKTGTYIKDIILPNRVIKGSRGTLLDGDQEDQEPKK